MSMFYSHGDFIEVAKLQLERVDELKEAGSSASVADIRAGIQGIVGVVGPYIQPLTNHFGVNHWSKELWHQSWWWEQNIDRAPSWKNMESFFQEVDISLFYPPVYSRWFYHKYIGITRQFRNGKTAHYSECPMCGNRISDDITSWSNYMIYCQCFAEAGNEYDEFLNTVLETHSYANPEGDVETVDVILRKICFPYLTLEKRQFLV